ncbi:MAG: hypothetical protein J6U89_07365 [Bacteroidaceae bacterium]|nr:hypothetical protein [Bacteroidaceae bacterium]
MADRITTILDVQLDAKQVAAELEELSRQIANAKNEQKLLNEQLKAGEITETEYAKSTAAVKDELSWLQKQQKGVIATQKILTAESNTYSDSLNGQRQKLADMQKAYDQLTASQRESASGRAFLEALKEQSDTVKELEEATGRAQRNVGNYPKAVTAAVPALGKLQSVLGNIGVSIQDLSTGGTKAFANLGTSLKTFGKAFLTPPIVVITAVLSAIMWAIQKVSEAFKKNDNAMTALTKAFAIFEPIGDGVKKVFDAVAEALGKVALGAAKVVQWIAGKLSPSYAEAAAKAQELVQAQDDLQEAERQYTVESAKRNVRIAELRNKSMQAAKYDAEERKKFLQEAIALEKKNLEEAKANAAERVRIMEETAKKESDTSDETKDKIAQARAQMYQAEESYYSGVRKLEKQLTDFEAEEHKARADAWAQEWRDKVLLAEAEAATLQAKNEELQQRARDLLDSIDESEEEDEIESVDDMVKRMFGLDVEGVEYFRELLEQGVSYADAKTMAIADHTTRMAQSFAKSFGQLGSAFMDMGEALGEFASESEEAAKAQKAFTLTGIILNQAQSISEGALAIAKGVESAAAIPFPANIPAIFTVVATIGSLITGVASSIMQAKNLFSQADAGNFSDGGTVGGSSYTGDKLIAHVNSGEGIYNGTQANNLLHEIASNPLRGGGTQELAAAIAAAVENVHIALVYEEFRDFEKDVTTYDELANI